MGNGRLIGFYGKASHPWNYIGQARDSEKTLNSKNVEIRISTHKIRRKLKHEMLDELSFYYNETDVEDSY